MSSSATNLAREVLEEVETGTPFNNSAAYAAEFLPPEKLPAFGGDCISLSREIQSRLLAAGFSPQTLVERNRREWHYSTICEIDGELMHLDPTIFTVDPISLSALFRSPWVHSVYPTFHSASINKQVVAISFGEQTFQLSKARFQNPFDSYNLAHSVCELPAPARAQGASCSVPRQTFDIIAVPSRRDVLHLRYSINRRATMMVHQGRLIDESDSAFFGDFARLSEQLGFPANELVEILESCADAHNKRHRR